MGTEPLMKLKRYIAQVTIEGLIGIDILRLQQDLETKHGDNYNHEMSIYDNLENLEGAEVAQELLKIVQKEADIREQVIKPINAALP